MKKTLSFALALVLCLGLTLPACAAEKTYGPTGTAGSSTVSGTKGNNYTLSNSILYKIDRATPPFNSFEGQSMFSDENEIDTIYAVPAGTVVTAPSGVMFPVDESWDVVWNDGTPSLMIYGTGGEGFSSYEMSGANVLWVFPCHLTAFTGDNFSMEGHTGTIAFYTPDEEHAAANPFASTAPNTPDNPTIPEVSNKTAFTDVAAGAYYEDAIAWAVTENITSGTSATTFSPDENCTVGQILTFLWRSKGSPEPTIKNPYSNIKESDYYYKALLWATELDLIASDEGIFNANLPCTRIGQGPLQIILDKCAGVCYHNKRRVVAGVVELVDTGDLKSPGSDTVPVRVRSPAPHLIYRGVEQLVARRAHNPEVAGSSPVSATMIS